MTKRGTWPSVLLTLLSLPIVYDADMTFFPLELERLVERTITLIAKGKTWKHVPFGF